MFMKQIGLFTFSILFFFVSFLPVFASEAIFDKSASTKVSGQTQGSGAKVKVVLDCTDIDTIDSVVWYLSARGGTATFTLWVGGVAVDTNVVTGLWQISTFEFTPAVCGDIEISGDALVDFGQNATRSIPTLEVLSWYTNTGGTLQSAYDPMISIFVTRPVPVPEIEAGFVPLYFTDSINSVICETIGASTTCDYIYDSATSTLSEFDDTMKFLGYLFLLFAYFSMVLFVFLRFMK